MADSIGRWSFTKPVSDIIDQAAVRLHAQKIRAWKQGEDAKPVVCEHCGVKQAKVVWLKHVADCRKKNKANEKEASKDE